MHGSPRSKCNATEMDPDRLDGSDCHACMTRACVAPPLQAAANVYNNLLHYTLNDAKYDAIRQPWTAGSPLSMLAETPQAHSFRSFITLCIPIQESMQSFRCISMELSTGEVIC